MEKSTHPRRMTAAAWTAVALIRMYQMVSAFGPRRCRFYPTCSSYGIDALRVFGFWKGAGKTLVRILKCHPLHPGGYDPVHP